MAVKPSSPWLAHNVLAWLAAVVIAGLSAEVIWSERSDGYRRAEVSVLNTAGILANQVESSLDRADALLVTVGKRYVSARTRGASDVDQLIDEVSQELPSFPLVSRLGITDAQGHVLLNTGYDKGTVYHIDLSDRDYFQKARSGVRSLIHTGPVKARLAGEWSLVLSRRLDGTNGEFLGVVFVVLPVESFGKDFFNIDLGPTSVINLRTLDLAQVARHPGLEGSDRGTGNRNVSQTARALLDAHPERDQHTYTTVAPIDGVQRVYAYKRLSHSPYWMTFGVSTHDFLMRWQQTAIGMLALNLAIIGLLVWGSRKLTRQHESLKREIVEKEKVEHALRESDAQLTAMLNAIPDALLRLDDAGRVLHHKEAIGTFNAADQGQRDKPQAELLELIRKRIGDTLATATLHTFESEISPADGDRQVYETRMVPSGQHEVIAVVRDITQRKTAEFELTQYRQHLEELVRRQTADLVAANQKLEDTQFAMNAVGIGITWSDIETGRFIYANRYSAEFLGYTVEEMLERSLPDIDPHYPSDAYAELCETARQRGFMQFETWHRTKEGLLRPVEMTIFYHAGHAHSTPRLIEFMTDIARRKEAEKALIDAKLSAEVANRAKSAFLANMSHEIRTPLNAITGMVHVIRRAGVTPEQKHRLDTIENAGAHLIEIINAVLDLSKIEAGKFSLDETDIRPEVLIENVTSILRHRAEQKRLRWRTEIEALPPGLIGDPIRTQQALLNYASNAIKFTDTGSITLRVRLLEEGETDALIRFEVEDTGIGIAPEALTRLFSSFEQADNSTTRKYGGTGLGLAITKKFAQLMGGEVGVSSAPGEGSLFWFSVRLGKNRKAPGGAEVVSPLDAGDILRQEFSATRILLVEDEPINCDIARMLLGDQGLIIDVAENGLQAVELARQNDYAAILMDMQMPVMDGIEATQLIRELPRAGTTPIIAMTANVFIEDRVRCLSAGMNAFLAKPVDPTELFAVLLIWLRKHKQINTTQ